MNIDKIKIQGYNILVLPDKKVTKIITINETEPLEGTVISIGPKVKEDIDLKVGDKVNYAPSTVKVKIDNIEYTIIQPFGIAYAYSETN